MPAFLQSKHGRSMSSSHKFVLRPFRNSLPIAATSTRRPKTARGDLLDESFDDADSMSTSFHQFCATCDRQIAVPNVAVLYCSERCRRHDDAPADLLSPSDFNNKNSPSAVPPVSVSLSEYEAFIGRPIKTRRKFTETPTVALSSVSPAVLHNGKADLDPTEWKPDAVATTMTGVSGEQESGSLTTGSDDALGKSAATSGLQNTAAQLGRTTSEAYLYLSKFHKSSESFASLSASSSSRRAGVRKTGRELDESRDRVVSDDGSSGSLSGSSSSSSLSSSGSSCAIEVAAGAVANNFTGKAATTAPSTAPSIFICNSDNENTTTKSKVVSNEVQNPDYQQCQATNATASNDLVSCQYPKQKMIATLAARGAMQEVGGLQQQLLQLRQREIREGAAAASVAQHAS